MPVECTGSPKSPQNLNVTLVERLLGKEYWIVTKFSSAYAVQSNTMQINVQPHCADK